MFGLVLAVSVSGVLANVTDDGKVTKEIVVPGALDGLSPKDGDEAKIHYVGRFPNGAKFDSSRDRDQPLSFVVGKTVIAGLSAAVKQMKVGELANVTIGYQYGYGERGYPPMIPARADLEYEVELLEFTPVLNDSL